MYLLLAGSSPTARALVTDTFLGGHPDWKHLALEDIFDEEPDEEDVLGMKQTFMTMIACQCAKDARSAGAHIIITCPSPAMIDGVRGEIPEQIVTVHLGAVRGADGFDHIIDTRRKSARQTSEALDGILRMKD